MTRRFTASVKSAGRRANNQVGNHPEAASRLSHARIAALAALHASRRGRPVNEPGVPARDLRALHRRIIKAVTTNPERGRISYAALARHCGVCPRQARRWVYGIHTPPAAAVRKMTTWLRRIER